MKNLKFTLWEDDKDMTNVIHPQDVRGFRDYRDYNPGATWSDYLEHLKDLHDYIDECINEDIDNVSKRKHDCEVVNFAGD